jgi:putative transposase
VASPKHRTASGSSYFVTTRCWEGRNVFQVTENAVILVEALFRYRDQGSYFLHEFVVMPNHLHLLVTPSASTSLEKDVQLIKGGSSHTIHKQRENSVKIWQEGFHDWTIRDANDWETKVEYIRLNPVRARLAENAADWPFSSASGRYTLDAIPERYIQLASGAKAP